MASSSTLPSETSTTSHPEEEDPAVEKLSRHLSDLNTKFCDHLSQQLQEVFVATVPDFPRLERPEILLKRLENSYMRHVDVMEVYAGRNIFTLDNIPPNRRARIAQLFAETPDDEDAIVLQLRDPPAQDHDSSASLAIDLQKLASAPAPTREQVREKRRSVAALATKLDAMRRRKAVLERRVGELEVAQQMTTTDWNDKTAAQVQESVSALLMGVHGVEDCQEQGEAALQTVKKRNLEDDDDEDDDDRLTWNPLSPQPQNVQELYEKERKRIHATTQDLQHVHQMLVNNKTNTSGK